MLKHATKAAQHGKSWWSGKSKHIKLLIVISVALIIVLLGAIIFALGSEPTDPAADNNLPQSSPQTGDNDDGPSDDESDGSPVPTSGNLPALTGPAKILNLKNWKLTLPINTSYSGNPDEIKQPTLSRYSKSPYFKVNGSKNGVIFRAHAGGATTSNSGYPRSELREMANNGSSKASWSSTKGTHTMTIRQAITHLPSTKPHVVAGQIHDAEDDIMMIRLERKHLFVEADGDEVGTLDKNYSLGKTFTIKIEAKAGKIKVFYNGVQKVTLNSRGSGYYFKAGCYTQSNTSKGDKASAYGQVIIYKLATSHKY